MSTVLKNIVSFTGLLVGVPTSLPHNLNINGLPVIPQLGGVSASGFTVTADTVNITVTRTVDATSGALNVYVEHWHTIEALTPPGGLAGFTPFFFSGGGGGGSLPINTTRTIQALSMIPEQYTLGWQVAANFTLTGGPWTDFAATDAEGTTFAGVVGAAHAGPIYFTPDSLVDAVLNRIDPFSWATALGSATDRTWIILINSLDGTGFRGVGAPVTPTGFPLTLVDASVFTGAGSLDLGGANIILQPGEAIMLHRVDGIEIAPIWRIAPL